MPVEVSTNLDYLIDTLRLHLGDTNPVAYRYLDEWLRTSLIASVKTLMPWWNDRYTIDETYNVIRNTMYKFEYAEPPVIQLKDERPIILMASIIIKGGSLENMSWSLGSWKDNEISYSSIESGRAKEFSLDKDWKELQDLIKPPQKRLVSTEKRSLPGYLNNRFENRDK